MKPFCWREQEFAEASTTIGCRGNERGSAGSDAERAEDRAVTSCLSALAGKAKAERGSRVHAGEHGAALFVGSEFHMSFTLRSDTVSEKS